MAKSDDALPEVARRVLENLHTMVLLFDRDLRLRYLNPAAEMLFSVSAARLIGVKAESLYAHGGLVEVLREAIASGHPITERERMITVGSGHDVTVDLTAVPLTEPGREPELLVEMNQVDRQLRISREENLLAQGQATRALARGFAHEVKNPLGGLRGAAQLLDRELSDAGLKEYTGVIINEADRLRNLINRMLGPNAAPRKEPVNIHEVLERVRQLVTAEAPPGVGVRPDYDPSLPDFPADRDMLIQAFLNLVRNAVQAVGDEGEVTLRSRILRQYTIGQTRHKLVARVDVIDNGPGVPPEEMDRIFLPMVTGRAEGSGLGLPLAQGLVNQHGGLIECESRPGRTVFTVLLPLASPSAPSGREEP